MTTLTYKEQITAVVLEQVPTGFHLGLTQAEAMRQWWQTGARSNGLRLTELGDLSFRVAEIEFYQYDFKVKLAEGWHGYILDMSKKLQCPYFLGTTKTPGKKQEPYIRLYDSKIAMMISLYGDIDSYLKSVKIRK